MSPLSFCRSLPLLFGVALACGSGGSGAGGYGGSAGSASGGSGGSPAGDSGPGSSCTWSGGPTDDGEGQITCYIYNPGSHVTGCGNTATLTGTPVPGAPGCGQTSFTESVSNIANPLYYAAFDSTPVESLNCGLCVEITYGGHTMEAHVDVQAVRYRAPT